MLIGASWPWNLSTVPTNSGGSPAVAAARSIAPTWALYGATITMSSTVIEASRPSRSIHVGCVSSSDRTSSAIVLASSAESVSLPACGTGR